MLISDAGTLVRIRADEISLVGRNTQGVTLINLQETEKLVGLQRIAEINIEEVPGLNLDQDLDQDLEQDDNAIED
jgi:DNA gyrase subunit A